MVAETIEDYIEAERLRQINLKNRDDKYERNAELITLLDKKFKMLVAYPLDNDPTSIGFWSDNDPKQYPYFNKIMFRYRKTCRVERTEPKNFYVTIDDIKEHY